MKNNRRKLLKALTLGGGAATAWKLPTQWSKPVVESVVLPSHAQTTQPAEDDEPRIRPQSYFDSRSEGREVVQNEPIIPQRDSESLFARLGNQLVNSAHAQNGLMQYICIETGYEGGPVSEWRGQVRYSDAGTDYEVYSGSGTVGGAADSLSKYCGAESNGTLEVKSASNSKAYVVLNLEGYVNPVFEGYVYIGECPFGSPEDSSCFDSDRNIKDNFQSVDEDEILERVSQMPVEYWTYTDRDPGVRHIGPMAQDFRAAFNVGDSDRHIHMVDANGVNLASIKALYKRLREKDEKIATLEADLRTIKEKLGLPT